ncbi:MAG: WbuC family cupin fold metalloprotein [Spirochaetia bacterium]|nr:WbuC family cupin fold metalloprotein [Spirochaetia bacterium]
MIQVRKESAEVLYPDEPIVTINSRDVEVLKRLADENARQRVRLCAHRSPGDSLHEMFIVHKKSCYVRPHKHPGKAESMFVVEGAADVVLFRDDGTVDRVFPVGAHGSGRGLYYRISDPVFHMLLIRSDYLVFHEVTEGPFRRGETVFAEWAPADGEADVSAFVERVDAAAALQLEHMNG